MFPLALLSVGYWWTCGCCCCFYRCVFYGLHDRIIFAFEWYIYEYVILDKEKTSGLYGLFAKTGVEVTAISGHSQEKKEGKMRKRGIKKM